MMQTKIWRSIKSLTPHKKTAFSKFLQSPYFNQRPDLYQLYEVIELAITKEKELSLVELEELVSVSKKNIRLLLTYLQRLFEQFIAVEEVLDDKVGIKLKTASWFRNCGENKLHQSLLKDINNQIEKQGLKNAEYYYQHFELELEKYKVFSRTPDKNADFQQLMDSFDMAFISIKLRQSCLLMAHDQLYNSGFDSGFLEHIFDHLLSKNMLSVPAIGIYYHCYRMLENPEEEKWFQSFKEELLVNGHLFGKEETQDLYLLAINYGIRRVNDGFQNYFQDIMDFYQEGLNKEYLLQGGELSRFTYNNIVSVALQIGMADWAEKFIEEWANRLERRYRERMFSFNQAKIAYHRKDYDAAISLLQRSNYHDLLLNLSARSMLLKIYYELNEFDLLDSHLDAFSSYLRRKSGLGYHRSNYRNLIRYTKKLLTLNFVDKKERNTLKTQIQKEEKLTDKNWLLDQLGR